MNLLYKNNEPTNYIWIAPTRTGSRGTNNVFEFNNYEARIVGPGSPQFPGRTKYTHSNFLDKKYANKNYSIICNTRNPYYKVVSDFNNIAIFNDQIVNIADCFTHEVQQRKISIVDDIFQSFITGEKINFCETINVLPCVIKNKTFDEYVRKTLKNKHFFISYPLNVFDKIFVIKTETFLEDLKNIPFIEKIPPNIEKNIIYFHDKKKFLRNHFINCVLKTESIDSDVYKDYIEKSIKEIDFIVKDNKEIYIDFLRKFYLRLLSISKKEEKEFIDSIKKIFICSENYKRVIELYDLTKIKFKITDLYNEELAKIVYDSYEDWFVNFGYEKDSWNADIIL